MFTGLVSDVGEVERVDAGANLHRLRIVCSYAVETIVPGASIACGGACLTVVAGGESGNRSWFEVDAGLRLSFVKSPAVAAQQTSA
jgi:riboflavin synthase